MDVDCNKACRTCGKIWSNPAEMYPIFHENADSQQPHDLFTFNKYLADFLFNSLKIKIYDGMPQSICSDCNNGVIFITQFFKQCESAQEILEKTFKLSISLDVSKPIFSTYQQVEDETQTVDNTEYEITFMDNEDEFDIKEGFRNADFECNKLEQHRLEPINRLNINEQELEYNNSATTTEITCPKCNQYMLSTADLIAHIIAKHPSQTCLICDRRFSREDLCKEHYKMHANCRYNCHICQMDFFIKDDLLRHYYTAHNISKYTCTLCNGKFYNKIEFNEHMNAHKTGAGSGQFTCKYCNKIFIQSSTLQIHEKKHETKPFSCTKCDASFPFKALLHKHNRSHSMKPVYKCTICVKDFRYRKPYKLHMAEHSAKKPRPFKCNECGKGFPVQSALKIHMVTHSGEKPFKCDMCELAFTQKGNLNTHCIKRHGGFAKMSSIIIDVDESSEDPLNNEDALIT